MLQQARATQKTVGLDKNSISRLIGERKHLKALEMNSNLLETL